MSTYNLFQEVKVKVKEVPQAHTHSYFLRISPNGKDTYYCSLPSCTHCLNIPHQVIGRKSLCQQCFKEFIIGEDRVLVCETCNEG